MQFADAIKKKPPSELDALVEAQKKETKELASGKFSNPKR
jgi:hypothetical protein